jgi:hypothetical protein
MISNGLSNRLISLNAKQEKYSKHLDSLMQNFYNHTEGSPAIVKLDSKKFLYLKNEVEFYLFWDVEWSVQSEIKVNIKITPADEIGKEIPLTKILQLTIDILGNVRTDKGTFSLDEPELAEHIIMLISYVLAINL